METRTYNVYTFAELTPEAQEKALNDWRLHDNYEEYCEEMEALKIFAGLCGFDIQDYSISLYERSYIKTNIKSCKLLSVQELQDIILTQGHYPVRDWKECPLTGIYIEHDLLEPLFTHTGDSETILSECLARFIEALKTEMGNRHGDDYIKETIIANEYYFLENGQLD